MNEYKSHRAVTGLLTYVSFWLRDRSSQLHKVKLELGPVLSLSLAQAPNQQPDKTPEKHEDN